VQPLSTTSSKHPPAITTSKIGGGANGKQDSDHAAMANSESKTVFVAASQDEVGGGHAAHAGAANVEGAGDDKELLSHAYDEVFKKCLGTVDANIKAVPGVPSMWPLVQPKIGAATAHVAPPSQPTEKVLFDQLDISRSKFEAATAALQVASKKVENVQKSVDAAVSKHDVCQQDHERCQGVFDAAHKAYHQQVADFENDMSIYSGQGTPRQDYKDMDLRELQACSEEEGNKLNEVHAFITEKIRLLAVTGFCCSSAGGAGCCEPAC
jgi:hypothetical protein